MKIKNGAGEVKEKGLIHSSAKLRSPLDAQYFIESGSWVLACASIVAAPWVLSGCFSSGSAAGHLLNLNLGASSSGGSSGSTRTAGDVSDFVGVRGAASVSGGVNAPGSVSNLVGGMRADSAHNLYFSDNAAIRKLSPSGVLTTLAGASNSTGYVDDIVGTNVRFGTAKMSLAVDQFGNIYVADSVNRALRKVTPTGATSTVVYYSNWLLASTDTLIVAVDPLGMVGYVVNTTTGKLWRVNLLDGSLGQPELSYAQIPGFSGTVPPYSLATSALDITTDKNGNFFALDLWTTGTPGTPVSSTLNGYSVDSMSWTQTSSNQSLSGNLGLSFQSVLGAVLAANPSGTVTGTGLTVDENGNVYVADSGTFGIDKIDRQTNPASPAQALRTSWGLQLGTQGYVDGPVTSAQLNSLSTLAADYKGNLYFADDNGTLFGIRKLNLATQDVITVVANPTAVTSSDGITREPFQKPWAVVQDPNLGNFYVLDSGNLLVSQVSASGGIVTPFAGFMGGAAAAPPLQSALISGSLFVAPLGMSADGSGNIYVADAGSTSPSISSFVAQINLSSASTSGVSAVVQLGAPAQAIASDSTNTYVVDNTGALYYGANSSFSTLSALSPITLTGPGNLTNFGSAVGGLVSDGSGKLYVADSGNRQIYTLTLDSLSLLTSGTFTVLAGSGVSGSWDGQGTSATFSSLAGITRDGTTGYLFVSDGNLIRKITPSGTVTTVAGRSVAGSSNGSGTAANFASPKGLTMGQDGELYVADSGNALIRRLKIK